MNALHAISPAEQTQVIAFPQSAPVSLGMVFRPQPVERIPEGRAVFWEGDAAKDVVHVVSGVLRLYRILPCGKRAIAGFAFAGEVLGLSFRGRCSLTAEAVGEAEVRRFPRNRFHALVAGSAELRPLLLSSICDELYAAHDQMLVLLRSTAETRLACFLLLLARKTARVQAGDTEIEVPMLRSDIADFLGLTVETVSREMTKMRKAGLIALNGPHRVTVLDRDALAELAGDDGDADEEDASAAARASLRH